MSHIDVLLDNELTETCFILSLKLFYVTVCLLATTTWHNCHGQLVNMSYEKSQKLGPRQKLHDKASRVEKVIIFTEKNCVSRDFRD